jgi:hypothetical protein
LLRDWGIGLTLREAYAPIPAQAVPDLHKDPFYKKTSRWEDRAPSTQPYTHWVVLSRAAKLVPEAKPFHNVLVSFLVLRTEIVQVTPTLTD